MKWVRSLYRLGLLQVSKLFVALLVGISVLLIVCNATPFVATHLLLLTGPTLITWLADSKPVNIGVFVAGLLLAEMIEPLMGTFFLMMAYLPILLVTGRVKFSLIMSWTLLGCLYAGIQLKEKFAGSPLTFQDLRYFLQQWQDNIGVFVSQPTLLLYAGGFVALATVLAVWAWRSDQPASVPWRIRLSTWRHPGLWMRLGALGLALWVGSEVDAVAAEEARRANAWNFSERHRDTPISNFLSTLHLTPKANFLKTNTEQFAELVTHEIQQSKLFSQRPDIVLVLQESQFNPMAIQGCPAALCQVPAFNPDSHTTDQGPLRVHTYGGGTWLSEFTSINGVPHYIFGSAGHYAPYNIAPGVSMSLVKSIKRLGYRTVAVYPVRGGMMNARLAYSAYGFDAFFDSQDLGLSGSFLTPDDDIHRSIEKVLAREQKHGQPVFLMALTIFNHSEHGVMMDRVPASLRTMAANAIGAGREADNLADYVWRSQEFDRSMAKLKSSVLGGQRGAVIAWFGDHQPPFGNAGHFSKRIQEPHSARLPSRMITWYNISSNFEGRAAASDARTLDITFLPGLLTQRAGLPLDNWLAANVVARKQCAGLFAECEAKQQRDAYLSYLLGDLMAINP